MKFLLLFLTFLTAGLLAGCATSRAPVYGSSGSAGGATALQAAPVLVVPTPDRAALSGGGAQLYAADLVSALAALEVPSVARPAHKNDWRIITTATLNSNNYIPHYAITGPDGKHYGGEDGGPVAAADWTSGDPAALNKVATADAVTIAKMLAAVNAEVQQGNPNSLENRPPRLFLAGVTGAPGDGDSALALKLNGDLPPLGVQLVSSAALADFTVNGAVKTEADTNNQVLAEIEWVIRDSSNRAIGRVVQLHDLNPADFTPYWAAAATQGATGIREVIVNATLHKAKPLAAPAST